MGIASFHYIEAASELDTCGAICPGRGRSTRPSGRLTLELAEHASTSLLLRSRIVVLPRTLEPEVMDSAEEAAAYDAMDHRQVNERFVDDVLIALPELDADNETAGDPASRAPYPPVTLGGRPADCWPPRIIDLGTGTARIPVVLCRRNRELRLVATDLAESMLRLARLNVELGGCGHQVRLDKADAKQLPYASGMWDVVLSNSLLHHLPDPAAAVREIWRIVRPGGTLFVRDLARPDDEGQLNRLVETYARDESGPARDLFRASLHAALTVAEMQTIVAQAGGDSQAVQMTSDRHWTWHQCRPNDKA